MTLNYRRGCELLWNNTPATLKVWIGCHLKANSTSEMWNDGVETISIPRGGFVTSYRNFAKFCGVSVQQLRDALENTEKNTLISVRRTHRWSLITITNYDAYEEREWHENTVVPARGNTEKNNSIRKLSLTVNAQTEDLSRSVSDSSHALPGWLTLKTPIQKIQWLWFTELWSSYWRKVSKKAAWFAFESIVKTVAEFQQILSAVKAQAPEMLKREPSKRKHLASWLNGACFDDEVEADNAKKPAVSVSELYPDFQKPWEMAS